MATVVIVGGGFGGLAGARVLRDHLADSDEIVLVDRSDRFFMGFAKLWDLGGVRPLADGTVSLANLLDRGVRFVQAEIEALDPREAAVETTEGTFRGDALLVALGAGPAPTHRKLLSGAGAHDLYDAAHLPAMKADLGAVRDGRVAVAILGGPFKCPPAPYEAALIVDEHLRERGVRDQVDMTVVTPQPITLPVAGVDASRYVAQHLEERGVELLAEHVVTEVDPDTTTVRFRDGSELGYTVLLGVPAAVPPPVVAESTLAGDSGWIEPDRHTLRSGFDRVYAVGDCTLIPNAKGQLPKAGVFAAGQGEVAARNILADLGRGEEARFDGHGYCFLELPGRRVAFVEGDFYAEPEPDVRLTEADEEQFRRKQAFEQERLEAWLG